MSKKPIPQDLSQRYKLPSRLTDFQLKLYVHLIEWKWENITKKTGTYGDHEYDAILPEEFQAKYYPLYQPIVPDLKENHVFKSHKFLGHMASSQAASINLFAPLLKNPEVANKVLGKIHPDFQQLATEKLEKGFQFEYWDKDNLLGDHNDAAGTDADVAIAYYNHLDELCLWLIEHKLTEDEFTTCGGYSSKNNKTKDACRNASIILNDPGKCHYTSSCGYKFWSLTNQGNKFKRSELEKRSECPFKGGENQLWRNTLLAQAIQKKGEFKKVTFSVVHHPDNPDLMPTLNSYRSLLTTPEDFTVLTLDKFVKAAGEIKDKDLETWLGWYMDLYKING